MRLLFCAAEQEELDCALQALRLHESQIAGKAQVDFILTGICNDRRKTIDKLSRWSFRPSVQCWQAILGECGNEHITNGFAYVCRCGTDRPCGFIKTQH